MNSARLRYLSPSTVMQPLIHRWYAVPYVVAPHTGALNLTKRFLPALRSYLAAPSAHAAALRNPEMFGAPFVTAGEAGPAGVEELLETTLKEGRPRIQLAEDIDAVRALLAEHGDGRALKFLYDQLPPTLRGICELVYDTGNHASLRFFEPLLYRTEAVAAESHVVSLMSKHDPNQPFIYSSPVLPGSPNRVDLAVPFAATELDALFAARLTPVDVDELAERFELSGAARESFHGLFTDEPPRPYQPAEPGQVRVRYFGHASVLMELDGFSVMTDPTLGYDGDGHTHFTIADLPERLDVVVLSHGHSDHVSLETLLQLRTRIGTIVVPRSSGGSIQDFDLRSMLESVGFTNVVELADTRSVDFGPAQVTALPFLGEHADLDIRAKMVPMVRIGGRGFLFATDTSPMDPTIYELVAKEIGTVDALFIGLECVGAPMTWLYGPLLNKPISREFDEDRGLKGSFANGADRVARQVGARQVFVYALGMEPWLKHLTGCWYDPDAEQINQSRILEELSSARGVSSELLYISDERTWPTGSAPAVARRK
jgi:L-ascorbate metabolism protein UlaG (beta-lactamase superfamily)